MVLLPNGGGVDAMFNWPSDYPFTPAKWPVQPSYAACDIRRYLEADMCRVILHHATPQELEPGRHLPISGEVKEIGVRLCEEALAFWGAQVAAAPPVPSPAPPSTPIMQHSSASQQPTPQPRAPQPTPQPTLQPTPQPHSPPRTPQDTAQPLGPHPMTSPPSSSSPPPPPMPSSLLPPEFVAAALEKAAACQAAADSALEESARSAAASEEPERQPSAAQIERCKRQEEEEISRLLATGGLVSLTRGQKMMGVSRYEETVRRIKQQIRSRQSAPRPARPPPGPRYPKAANTLKKKKQWDAFLAGSKSGT